jgi:zinc protease
MPTRPASLLTAALALALPLAAGADSKLFDLPYQTRELDNGLRVFVVPTDNPGTVSLQIPVQTGSRNEVEPGKSGFAHFFEHMMFRGTERFPADAYQAVIKNAGADQNAYTSSDLTNYHTNFTSEDLEAILEVEADRFQNLSYSEDQFRTEALAVKGEYLKNYSNPVQKAFEKLAETAYRVHPYGHTTMGYFEDIEDMPNQQEYSKVFFDRWYRPEYTSVIVVGDVDPEQTFALVEKHWGGWQRGSYTVEIPAEPPLEGPRYAHVPWEAPTLPWLLNSWRGPAFTTDDTDTAALMLLADIYFGQTSEIFQQLVVRERRVDQLFGSAPSNKDPGLFTIGARLTAPEHAQAVTDAISATLVRARSQPLDPAQLAETKSRMKYGFAASLNSAASIGATLARFVHYERDIETLNRLYAQFDRVTPEDVIAAAERVFTDGNRASVSIANGDELPGANGFASIDAAVAAIAAAPDAAPIRRIELRSESALINVAIRLPAGAAFDPPGKQGLAAMTASMLTQGGTTKRRYEEVQQAFYPLASGLSAQLDKETLILSGTVHRDNLQAWYAVVREMLLEPGFRDEDLVRLKQQQANAIRVSLRANNDEELGKEALYEMVYGTGHPYGKLSMGHAGEVEQLTMDDVRAFFAAHYGPAGMTVALGGSYSDAFRDRLLADLGTLPAATAGAPPVPLPAQQPRRARIIQKETPAVAVSFGWPIELKRGDPDWPALWLVRSYLGEHRNSSALLYQRIREERGMNYGSYAYIEYFPHGMFRTQPMPGYPRRNDLFQVWLRPLRDNNDALFATRTALFEIDRLVEQGMSQQQLDASRNFLHKFVAQLTASSNQRLGHALDADWFGTPAFVDYVRSELAGLTVERVNAAIRKHLQPQHAQFVFVAKDADGLKQAIASDTASPITYNTDKPAELLEEDARIAVWPLGLPAERIEVIEVQTVFE